MKRENDSVKMHVFFSKSKKAIIQSIGRYNIDFMYKFKTGDCTGHGRNKTHFYFMSLLPKNNMF